MDETRDTAVDDGAGHGRPGGLRFAALRRDQVTDGLVAEMLALYARAFPRWPNLDPEIPLADYLRWKMESPGSPYAAVVGRLGQKLVTARLVVRYRIRVLETSRVMLDSPDLAVDPDHQGQGISTAGTALSDLSVAPLSDLQVDDASNERVWKSRLRRSAALPIANPLRALYLVPDPGRFPLELLRGRRLPAFVLLFALRAATAATRLRDALRPPSAAAGNIRTVTRFGEDVDAFFEQAAAPFDLIYETDREHLNWRYCDRRAGPYVVRVFEQHGELLGYAVLRPAGLTAYLVDLLVLPGREDVAEALARDAVALSTANGATAISCWLPDRHSYRAVLRRVGFLTLPRPIPLRYRGQRVPTRELAFLDHPDARLHFTMGSTDMV